MILETLAIVALVGGGALLLRNKKNGSAGANNPWADEDGSFDQSAFVPDSKTNPSKVDKAFNIANQTISTGTTAAMAIKAAVDAYAKNPTPENKARRDKALAMAKKAAVPRGSKGVQAPKGGAAKAAKAPKQPKPTQKVNAPKTPSEKEKKTVLAARDLLVRLGVDVSSETEMLNELFKLTKTKDTKKLLKGKGLKPDEINTLMNAAKIVSKYKK